MAKVKTAELIGPALDWAVATIESETEHVQFSALPSSRHYYAPSRKWAQGGPLIQANLLVISPEPSKGWLARAYMDATEYYGPTPLIAAMRCLVASRLGEEVLIPQELLQ